MSAKTIGILILKILALTVVLMVINAIALQFLPAAGSAAETPETTAPSAPPSGSFMALVSAIMLLQTIALSYPIVRSKWHGWKLTLALFVLYFGTVTFMSQIESLVYMGGKMPEGMLGGLFAMGAVAAALFAPIAVLVLGKWKPAADDEASSRYEPRSASEWVWKIALGGFAYLALYYLFGYYVAWQIPEIRDYYGGTDPGNFIAQMQSILQGQPWMIPFQFLRGILWTALAVLVIRLMKGPWWEAGIAASALFAVPSFYLLLPNELMPEVVRMGHFVETLPYQFLFGWFAAWLFCRLGADKLSRQED